MRCDCAFGPRCESFRCCADDDQTVGVRDRRTGEIRKRADWIFIREPHRRFQNLRSMFLCDDCWQDMQKAWSKPLVGIDRPEHASDFWRPSIMEHIRLTRIKNEHAEKMQEADEALRFGAFSEKPMTARERAMTPERWKQILFIRQKFREFAASK